MAELVFLGTGAAWGIPELGCNCSACFEARRIPKWQRTRTSFIISSDSGMNILIDATTDLRAQLLRERISRIDAVIITHAHPDHFLGLDEFRARRQGGDRTYRNIPLFVGEDGWRMRISTLFSYLVEGDDSPLELKETLYSDSHFSVGEWTVQTFPTRHSLPEKIGSTFGFVFSNGEKKIVYTADYSEIVEPDDELLGRADIFISEATWVLSPGEEKERDAGHISFERAYHQYLRRLQPQQVVLVHISHEEGKTSRQWIKTIRSITKRDKDAPGIHLSYDGFRIKI